MSPTKFRPMPLGRARAPFTHRDWVFEIKWDGFRSLAFIENGKCRLVSRNGNEFKSFPDLSVTLPQELRNHTAILDGEVVCLNTHGKTEFRDLLFRRREPRFMAFDLLSCNGEDLRYMNLIDRKRKLRALIRPHGERLLYCDHVEQDGEGLFSLACEHDLEGIVAKRKSDPYLADTPNSWLKVRNTNYSQWVGREQLFERERENDTDFHGWECCTSICAGLREPYDQVSDAR